jgi:hypothetical protein
MRHNRRAKSSDYITAEIACFAYCLEQWRLQYGVGLRPGNQESMKAGTGYHEQKAVAERIAGGTVGIGKVVIVIAVLVLVLLWLVWR